MNYITPEQVPELIKSLKSSGIKFNGLPKIKQTKIDNETLSKLATDPNFVNEHKALLGIDPDEEILGVKTNIGPNDIKNADGLLEMDIELPSKHNNKQVNSDVSNSVISNSVISNKVISNDKNCIYIFYGDDFKDSIENEYYKLNKKIYVCDTCGSHKAVNNNEILMRCSRCGSSNLSRCKLPFIPYSLSEIRKMDTLEILNGEDQKYDEEAINYISEHRTDFMFLHRGVLKFDLRPTFYFYFEWLDTSDKEKMELQYQFYSFNQCVNSFTLLASSRGYYNGKIFLPKDMMISEILEPTERGAQNEICEAFGNTLCKCLAIFSYFAANRKTEEINIDIDRSSKKETISSRGNKIIKNKHIVYLSDSLKVYTYDSRVAKNIKNHKPIELPFWKVRGFTRRVFAKEDKELPMSQRRIVHISNVAPFLKGKERHMHSLDECGTIYRIAR